MSVGAEHQRPSKLAHGRALDVLLRKGGAPALLRRFHKFDIDHDIPYGVGVSVDGTARYADRDLVQAIYDPGHAKALIGAPVETGLAPDDTLECCLKAATVEKVLLDSAGPVNTWPEAHDYGSAAEQDLVRQKGSTPVLFRRGLAAILRHCASKLLRNVPKDLDCASAIEDKSANGDRILAELKKLGVADATKVSRESVAYGPAHGNDDCAGCRMWQGARGGLLSPCSLVQGLVRADRVCEKFEPTAKPVSPVEAGSTSTSAENADKSRQKSTKSDTHRVLVMRHGATSLNDDNNSVDRIRGWKDVPLSSEGRKEAYATGKQVAKHPPDLIVSSDLKRAHDTARIISKQSGAPYEGPTKAFRPWDVGKYAGTVSKKAIPILADYAENKPDVKMPGGADSPGESFNNFRARFFEGLRNLFRTHRGYVGIVTHHRGERLLKAWAANGFPADGSIDIKVFNQKGERTGHAEDMEIPLQALEAFLAHGGNTGQADGKSEEGQGETSQGKTVH